MQPENQPNGNEPNQHMALIEEVRDLYMRARLYLEMEHLRVHFENQSVLVQLLETPLKIENQPENYLADLEQMVDEAMHIWRERNAQAALRSMKALVVNAREREADRRENRPSPSAPLRQNPCDDVGPSSNKKRRTE